MRPARVGAAAHVMLVALLLVLAARPSLAGPHSVDEVRASGSLRGTELDGAWAAAGPRRAAEALLLRRFDHLLSALGETSLPELRRYIEREVTREHGAAAAQEVLSAWEAHLAVLRGEASSPSPLPGSGTTPEPALPTPKRPVPPPRALLTPDRPATEADAQTLHAQRIAHFGVAAAERLRAEDAARWAWAQRLDDARAALQAAGSAAAKDAELARRFAVPRERERARALLGLPPG